MSELVGNIVVPAIDPAGAPTFPLIPDPGYGVSQDRAVSVFQFGSANAKIEQRFLLGTGARRFSFKKQVLNTADREALRNFWENLSGPYGVFYYNVPDEAGASVTAVLVRFGNVPLAIEMLSDAVGTVELTFVEEVLVASAPTYSLTATLERFPNDALSLDLLKQDQELIPLVTIQPKTAGYPVIYVSDRRCTVGSQLYVPRLIDWDGIAQNLGSESDNATFNFGNADRVMRALVNSVDLMWAVVEFSLFHVRTGITINLWAGEVVGWSFDENEIFTLTVADGLHELRLPYPTVKLSRTCWKDFNNGITCPFATASTGMDLTHFPNGVTGSCDKGFDTENGCLAHGMGPYYGAVIAEPQGVKIKDNSTGLWGWGRSNLTSVSLVNETIYDQVLPEIYTDKAMPVNCKIAAGRDESDFYEALGIVGEGPLGSYGSLHTLDGQLHHGYPGTDGLRTYLGTDPAGLHDYLSLDQGGDLTGGDFRMVYYGASTYKNNLSAGVAFIVIRRKDSAGLQLSQPGDHAMQAFVAQGLSGWEWTAPGARCFVLLTNPFWVAGNMLIRAKGYRGGALLTSPQLDACEDLFDVDSAVAAAALADTRGLAIAGLISGTATIASGVVTVTVGGRVGVSLLGSWMRIASVDYLIYVVLTDNSFQIASPPADGTYSFQIYENQFRFRGVLQDEKPLRDWIQEIMMNCLGYFTFKFNKLKLGMRQNSGAVESFTEGNIVFKSLKLSPIAPSFNYLKGNFGDEEYGFANNSVDIYEIEHAKLVGAPDAPVYLKSDVSLVGSTTKSQTARIVVSRLREELGGVGVDQWRVARKLAFKTTVLSLGSEVGQIDSLTHTDMPDAIGVPVGRPYSDTFDDYTILSDRWTTIASGGMTAPFISTGLFHSGTQAVKIPQVGGDSDPVGQLCLSRMQRTFDATGTVNISFWLFVPAVQTNPIGVRDTDIIHFGLGAYPATVPQCGVSLSPTGKLQITVWDIPVAYATSVLPTEAWHFIEFTALIADVAGTAQVKADGSVVCSFAGRTTAGSSSVASPGETVDTYQFGAASWSADTLAQPWLYEYWLDDINVAGDITPNYGEFRVTSWRLNKDYSIDLEGRTTTDEMYDMVAGNKPADVHVDPIPDEPLSPQIASDLTLLSQSNGDLFVTVKAIDSPDFPVSKYKGFELFVIADLESQRTGATTALAANQLIGEVTLQLVNVAGLKVGDPINVGLEVETISGPGSMGDMPSSTTVAVARAQSLSVAAAHTLGDPVYVVTGIAPFTYMFPDGYIDSQALLTSGGVNYKLLQGVLQPGRMRIIYANVKLLSEHSPSDLFEKSFAISPGSPSAEDNVFGALPGIQTYDGLSDSISVNGPLEVGDDVADDLQFDPGTVLGVSVDSLLKRVAQSLRISNSAVFLIFEPSDPRATPPDRWPRHCWRRLVPPRVPKNHARSTTAIPPSGQLSPPSPDSNGRKPQSLKNANSALPATGYGLLPLAPKKGRQTLIHSEKKGTFLSS